MEKILATIFTLAVFCSFVDAADLPTETRAMSFEQCLLTREQSIATLNIKAEDIRPLVNSGVLTITRLCTPEGSILITCSKPDEKMIITKSPHGCQ